MGRSFFGSLTIWLLANALAGSPALAQRTTFTPSIAVGASYTDNVDFDAVQKTSDTSGLVTLELPLAREWSTGSVHFRYSPSYERHREQEQLDHDEHRLNLDLRSEPSTRSSLSFSTGFSRTQEQGRGDVTLGQDSLEDTGVSLEDDDVFLTRRTERDSLHAGLSFEHRPSQRWNWGTSAGWARRTHEEIPGVAVQPGLGVEDRDEVHASLEGSRNFTRATRAGLRYDYGRFDLELSGQETSNGLAATLNHDVSRKVNLSVALGGFRRSRDGSAGGDETGVAGSFDLVRSFERVRFGFNARRSPTSGDHLTGTSTNTEAGLSLSGTGSRVWDWSVSPVWARREPTDPTQATQETIAFGGQVERRFRESMGLRLGANYADTTSDDPVIPDRSVTTADLSFVWYPLGRRTARAGGATS